MEEKIKAILKEYVDGYYLSDGDVDEITVQIMQIKNFGEPSASAGEPLNRCCAQSSSTSEELYYVVKEYLQYGSSDGKIDKRGPLRDKMKELINKRA